MWSSDPVTIFMVLRGRSALTLTDRAAKSSCPFWSSAHEIISVYFSTGTVTPCDLGHCGITPLDVLCLKALRKKTGLGKTVTGVLWISYWDFQLIPLPVWPLENFLQPRGGYNSAAGPGDLLCWESLQSPCQPQDLLHQGLPLLSISPFSKLCRFRSLCSCAPVESVSPQSVFCYQILSSLSRITTMVSHPFFPEICWHF